MTLWQNPVVAAILAVAYLAVMAVWITFFSRRVDPWLRRKVGERFGVSIYLGAKRDWRVSGDHGLGGCLIELLQIVFWIPAVMLPVVIFLVALIILSGETL